jgi:hypothetical protein
VRARFFIAFIQTGTQVQFPLYFKRLAGDESVHLVQVVQAVFLGAFFQSRPPLPLIVGG